MTRIMRVDVKGSVPDALKSLALKRSGLELVDMRKAMLD